MIDDDEEKLLNIIRNLNLELKNNLQILDSCNLPPEVRIAITEMKKVERAIDDAFENRDW